MIDETKEQIQTVQEGIPTRCHQQKQWKQQTKHVVSTHKELSMYLTENLFLFVILGIEQIILAVY